VFSITAAVASVFSRSTCWKVLLTDNKLSSVTCSVTPKSLICSCSDFLWRNSLC
jgi:hypothetical protein